MIVVKLGGSIISDKSKPFSFRQNVVEGIAEEISHFYPKKKFLLVHGGGSYGHPLAKKYGIREGFDDEKMIGFSHTHQAMLELNKKIVDIFLKKNLPAFSVSPSSIFVIENGEVVEGSTAAMEALLEKNFIPVLFGDVAMARDRGMDILSGDQIISFIESKMEVEKVIFLMDVDGIYDKNPDEEGAELVEILDEKISIEGKTGKFDVTGGIKNKIEEAMKMKCPVYFINGMTGGNLTKAIEGKRMGTYKP